MFYPWITPRGNQPNQLLNTQEDINWKHSSNSKKKDVTINNTTQQKQHKSIVRIYG